jgi:hypothetical protein
MSFAACMTTNQINVKSCMSQRNERHWAYIGVPCENSHLKTIFTFISKQIEDDWPQFYRGKFFTAIINCTLDLRNKYT